MVIKICTLMLVLTIYGLQAAGNTAYGDQCYNSPQIYPALANELNVEACQQRCFEEEFCTDFSFGSSNGECLLLPNTCPAANFKSSTNWKTYKAQINEKPNNAFNVCTHKVTSNAIPADIAACKTHFTETNCQSDSQCVWTPEQAVIYGH